MNRFLVLLVLVSSFAQAREFDGLVSNSEFATLLETKVQNSVRVEVLSYRFVYTQVGNMIRNLTPLVLENTSYIYRLHLRTPATGPSFVRMICDIVYQNGDSPIHPTNSHIVYFPDLAGSLGDCHFWNGKGVELDANDAQVNQSGLTALSETSFNLDQAPALLEQIRQKKIADAVIHRLEVFENKISDYQYQIRCADASLADRACYGEVKRSQETMQRLGIETNTREAIIRALCKTGQFSVNECQH